MIHLDSKRRVSQNAALNVIKSHKINSIGVHKSSSTAANNINNNSATAISESQLSPQLSIESANENHEEEARGGYDQNIKTPLSVVREENSTSTGIEYG